MRFKSWSFLSILLIVGSIDARPSKLGSSEIVEGNEEKTVTKGILVDSSTWRSTEPRSLSVVKTDSRTELKSLDQSLRSVATQLLNVTSLDEPKSSTGISKITKNQKNSPNILPMQKNNEKTNFNRPGAASNDNGDVESFEDVNSRLISLGSVAVGFSRPVNSKFNYFESSHPGIAMAMTEEELERELMDSTSTRLITAHKNHPTTTGGISTWVLLNSPTTTSKSIIDRETTDAEIVNVRVKSENKFTTPVQTFETMAKSEAKTASTLAKIVSPQSTSPMERITTLTKSTTPSFKKPITLTTTTTETSQKPPQPTAKIEKSKVTSTRDVPIVAHSRVQTTGTAAPTTTPKTIITTTKKPLDINRSTQRPQITTPKAINVTSKPMTTKTSKPSNSSTKPKIPTTRNPSTKYPIETTKNPSTAKIEKVTFRPVPMITTRKSVDNRVDVEGPMFLTKVRTADTNASRPQSSLTNGTIVSTNENKSYPADVVTPLVAGKTKQPTRVNNVLKVQLKKPLEAPTNIEIQPIKVNAPVLRIEKIETKENPAPKRNSTKNVPALIPDDSRIDVKFDFNPEATKFEIEPATPVGTIATTTKRPYKRKKNKLRRRKPTTQTTSGTSVTVPTELATSTESLDILTELGIIDNTIQESKIAPESKVTPGKGGNNTKNKKKQVQKPIGTQIYNFLSREVMPSFGVMSLVGLGLGLASYFLYPFGGTIARRNYVVEQPYKYNMEEYGEMYGQNEEEVFSKVLEGMTNRDDKYGGIKNYESNFYRYQQPSGHAYSDVKHPTRRIPDTSKYSTSAASAYRPVQTTIHDHEKYRNTEFKYPELSSTANYYERPRKPDFVGKKSSDQQFVVGNVPKEYNYDTKANLARTQPVTTENLSTNFQQQDSHKFSVDTVDISPPYGQAEALKSHDDYEEIEITPAAVQVEHGPRSLKFSPTKLRRRRRESVIQLIPPRTEIEKEEKEMETEEPLSNEILDIIDSVIPGPAICKNCPKYSEISENEKMNGPKKTASTSTDIADRITQRYVGSMTETGITEKTTLTSKRDTESMEKTGLSLEQENTGTAAKSTTESSQPRTTSSISVDTGSTIVETISMDNSLTMDEIIGTTSKTGETSHENSSIESIDSTTKKPNEEPFNMFSFVKKIAEVKLRLGVAILKHASEGFARYLGHVQKRINGEE